MLALLDVLALAGLQSGVEGGWACGLISSEGSVIQWAARQWLLVLDTCTKPSHSLQEVGCTCGLGVARGAGPYCVGKMGLRGTAGPCAPPLGHLPPATGLAWAQCPH